MNEELTNGSDVNLRNQLVKEGLLHDFDAIRGLQEILNEAEAMPARLSGCMRRRPMKPIEDGFGHDRGRRPPGS